MSDRHDICEYCGNMPYYDGHATPICEVILRLERRVEELEDRLYNSNKCNIGDGSCNHRSISECKRT